MLVDIAFVTIAAILALLIWKLNKKKTPPADQPQDPVVPLVVGGVAPAAPARRWQRADQQPHSSQSQPEDTDQQLTQQQMKKKVRKEQRARQREARLEQIKEQAELADKKNQKYRERQEEMDRQEEEKKRKEEEAIRMMQEEDRKRKEEEYNKWKDFFVVESEGKDRKTPEQEALEKQQFTQKFLNYILDNKISLLEDMSNEFRLQTKDIVDKIKQLQAEGQINGVFDERGKYINVTEKEWKAILSYMKAKGRVSKSEMMLECSEIIKLEGRKKEGDGDLLKLIDEAEVEAK